MASKTSFLGTSTLFSAHMRKTRQGGYELRSEVAMLRSELETQAFQVQCFLEDTVSRALEKKMVARAAIQEWVSSFKKINDRNPLEADKIRSPRFTVLAEEYLAAQRKLEESLEEAL